MTNSFPASLPPLITNDQMNPQNAANQGIDIQENEPLKTKKRFSDEEDNQIRALVQQHGSNQWTLIAKYFPNRTSRQIRDRYRCYLAPNIVRTEWTLEEDSTLIRLHQNFGKQWSQLAKFFPGRTDVDLKNHWNKLQRHAKKLHLGDGGINPVMNQQNEINDDAADNNRM